MDDVVNRLARELADAICAAVTEDPGVEACREKARAVGYEMQVSLEAVIGFGSRPGSQAPAKIDALAPSAARSQWMDITANDRRFLRSLRITADEVSEKVE